MMKEVATALAIPNGQFRCMDIPAKYGKVQVDKVHEEHAQIDLDIMMPECIKLLGDAVN